MFSDGRLERAQHTDSGVPTSGAVRVLRGAAVGTAAMGLAVAGHVWAGGAVPAPMSGIAMLALTIAGSVALSGRRWTGSSLFTVLLGVQVVSHIAFGSHPMTPGMSVQQHSAHSMSVSMVVGHLFAASVTALLLSQGETWCWRLAALLGAPARAARAFTEHSPPARRVPRVPSPNGLLPQLRSLLLADAQLRRGPPALLAG